MRNEEGKVLTLEGAKILTEKRCLSTYDRYRKVTRMSIYARSRVNHLRALKVSKLKIIFSLRVSSCDNGTPNPARKTKPRRALGEFSRDEKESSMLHVLSGP